MNKNEKLAAAPAASGGESAASVSERAREILKNEMGGFGTDTQGRIPLEYALRAIEQALTQQRGAEPLGYTALFNAIAAATWPETEGVAINVSVAKFHESIGGNVYTTPHPSADAVRELVQQWRHNAQGCNKRDRSEQHAAGTWRSCARELESLLGRGGK